MREGLLTTAMLCAAVTAAAQSHEPTAKGGAKPVPLVSRITAAPKPTPPPAAAVAPAAKGPVALARVHGRLSAALSGPHEEPARSRRAAPAPPRYSVTWPAARWRVAWRDDAGRVVVSWPE